MIRTEMKIIRGEVDGPPKRILWELACGLVFAVLTFVLMRAEVTRVFRIVTQQRRFLLYRTAAFVVSIGFFTYLIHQVTQLFVLWGRRHADRLAWDRVLFFWLYLFVNLFVLLWVWPGIIKGDEYYVLKNLVDDLYFSWGQSLFTNIQYVLSLMIFPYLAGITFIQNVVICALAADIFFLVGKRMRDPVCAGWLLVPFLLLPVLDNNMFTLRASLISWILADVVVTIYTNFRDWLTPEKRLYPKLILLFCLIAVWKTEYIVLLPVPAVFFLIRNKGNLKRGICLVLALIVCFLCISVPCKRNAPASNYNLTAILNPLSFIVHENYDALLKNPDLQEEIRIIERDTPLSDINETYCAYNSPLCFWRLGTLGAEREGEYIRAAVRICLSYKWDFLRNRWEMFRATNGMVPNLINHTGSEDWHLAVELIFGGDDFLKEYFPGSHPPMGEEHRRQEISFLGCRNPEYYGYRETNCVYGLLYNSLIPFLLLLIHGLVSLFRRKLDMAFVDAAVLMVVPFLFLLAPANFWMYYMPFYLSSYTMLSVYILEAFSKKMGNLTAILER